jgi:hypothetical protein
MKNEYVNLVESILNEEMKTVKMEKEEIEGLLGRLMGRDGDILPGNSSIRDKETRDVNNFESIALRWSFNRLYFSAVPKVPHEKGETINMGISAEEVSMVGKDSERNEIGIATKDFVLRLAFDKNKAVIDGIITPSLY